MIDISDGLGRDASHIARMSGVQIALDAQAIPCNPGCTWRQALSDGEDYELLFCASQPPPMRIGSTEITRIGEVRDRAANHHPLVLVNDGGTILAADDLGWEHRS